MIDQQETKHFVKSVDPILARLWLLNVGRALFSKETVSRSAKVSRARGNSRLEPFFIHTMNFVPGKIIIKQGGE